MVRSAFAIAAVTARAETKFIQAMNDCKSGKRSIAMMKSAAASMSDADSANLAAFYASP